MKKRQLRAVVGTAILGLLSPLAMALPASAATAGWAGHHPVGGYDGKASTACNWEGCYAPVSGDSVEFPASGINQEIEFDGAHTVGVISTVELADIIFNGTWIGTSSKSYNITSDHTFVISGDVSAVMGGAGGDHQIKAPITLDSDSTFSTSGSNSLSLGVENGLFDIGANDLTLDANGGTITLIGAIDGTGTITKQGEGKVKYMLTGDGADISTTVSEGELVVDDELGLDVIVNGGTLKGTGTVGTVTMASGAIAPGASPGVLNTGDLSFTGGTHEVELGGTGNGEYDQLNVTGTVDLGSNTSLDISLFGGFEPEVDDAFIIIDNDGSDAISGTFEGLADGDKVTLGDYTYQINYDAGSGNDVTLLVTGTPAAPDTGVGSILNNPLTTLGAALLVAVALAGYRVYDYKKVRK